METLQKNLFSDVFLQVLGLQVLGEVYRLHPEFNNPEDYAHVNFGPEYNGSETKYSLRMDYVTRVNVCNLLTQFDQIVDQTARNMQAILARKTCCAWEIAEMVVGGTMRMHVSINHFEHDQIQFELMWIATEVA